MARLWFFTCIMTCSLFISGLAYASDDQEKQQLRQQILALQQENEQLKQENEQLKQKLQQYEQKKTSKPQATTKQNRPRKVYKDSPETIKRIGKVNSPF